MPVVKAGPSQYLLVGRHGTLENRGSAVQAVLRPGTIFVLVPGTKQEASFEFTQETKDGIPLRFKGTFIYRIVDPVAAARLFDFSTGGGVGEITSFLTHVCLGELRHAVSHMTMAECIEQRKTTLSGVVETALQSTIRTEGDPDKDWGLTVEAARVAQVFIVDADLRQQLEAEVRNEIKLRSDRSDLQSREAMDLATLARERRMAAENLATERQALEFEQERFHRQADVDQDRVNTETPVRLLRIELESEVLREELKLRELQNQVRALKVERDLVLARAQQEMRLEMLPLEQTPQIVEAASRVLHGTNLSIYGEDSQLLGQVAPIFELLSRAVGQATQRPVAANETHPAG